MEPICENQIDSFVIFGEKVSCLNKLVKSKRQQNSSNLTTSALFVDISVLKHL